MNENLFRENPQANWQSLVYDATLDENVLAFVKKTLTYGYNNIGIPSVDDLVNGIFEVISNSRKELMKQSFETIRTEISGNWHGRSIKDRWAEYYKNVEAPFIVDQILPHLTGQTILEVGTGRGLISRELSLRSSSPQNIYQTDVADYRSSDIRNDQRFHFTLVNQQKPIPFESKLFDTSLIVYVLHHMPIGTSRIRLLKELERTTRKRLIILEDVYLKDQLNISENIEQSPFIEQFSKFNQRQQELILAFQCAVSNKIDGGGSTVPCPCSFYSLTALLTEFATLFPYSKISSSFLGIPKSKVYLNPEALFVVSFDT